MFKIAIALVLKEILNLLLCSFKYPLFHFKIYDKQKPCQLL